MNAFLSLGSITIDLLNIELARLLKKGLQSDPGIRRFPIIEHFIRQHCSRNTLGYFQTKFCDAWMERKGREYRQKC